MERSDRSAISLALVIVMPEQRLNGQAGGDADCWPGPSSRKHPPTVSTGNETDGRLTNSQSSSGSQDLGEHGKSQHPQSGYKAPPSGVVSFPHAGGALAKPRM